MQPIVDMGLDRFQRFLKERRFAHENVKCQLTGRKDFVGMRMKCASCSNFDLCYEAYKTGLHPCKRYIVMFKKEKEVN